MPGAGAPWDRRRAHPCAVCSRIVGVVVMMRSPLILDQKLGDGASSQADCMPQNKVLRTEGRNLNE